MKTLQRSEIRLPQIEGDENLFSRKSLAKDFGGLMNPIVGIEHFELTRDELYKYGKDNVYVINYIFDRSAPCYIINASENKRLLIPGSLVFTSQDNRIIPSEFPNLKGKIVEGLQLVVKLPAKKDKLHFENLIIEKEQIPEINRGGVRVKVLSGQTGPITNTIQVINTLTFLHIFLDKGMEFEHLAPIKWSVTLMVMEGRMDFSTSEETIEIEEGMTLSMGNSDVEENLKFTAITPCEIIVVSGIPKFESNIPTETLYWNPMSF
tara:strand:+ start:61998 stop:62789 length:792 start_codon:yes stop_codon:yes gene_type:complete